MLSSTEKVMKKLYVLVCSSIKEESCKDAVTASTKRNECIRSVVPVGLISFSPCMTKYVR